MANKTMVKLTSLWKNTSKNGDKYYSGYLQDSKILIFKNKSEKENSPYFDVFVCEKQDKKKKEESTDDDDDDDDDDDIPF